MWPGEELLDMTDVAKKIEKLEEEVTDEMLESMDTITFSEYEKVVLSFISGAILRYVRLDLDCQQCFGFFENGEELGENSNFTLIQKKDLAGLVKPCPDVVDLIECVNSVVESEALDPNMLSDSRIFN